MCQSAFEQLIDQLLQSKMLAYPCDVGTYILDTDASEVGIGAVLSQLRGTAEERPLFPKRSLTVEEKESGQEEKVIAYASRTLSKEEKKYCVTRKELLAVVYFMNYFRHYLIGRTFKVRSDHQALKWIFKLKDPTGQMARSQESLASFTFHFCIDQVINMAMLTVCPEDHGPKRKKRT